MIRVPFVRKDQKRFINYFSYECSLSYRSWKQFENFWFMLSGKYVEFTLKDVFVARQAGESDQLLNYLFILGKLHERMSPKTAWNYKMWHMLEKLVSRIFCSEIPYDELINVVYLFCSDLLMFSQKTRKIVHVANRYKMVDIKGPSISTRTSLLKSAEASSLFFFLCISMGGIGKLAENQEFSPKFEFTTRV